MAGENRHIKGDTEEIHVKVHGNTAVDPGDLMFLNDHNSQAEGYSSPDYYAFPFDLWSNASGGTGYGHAAYDAFLGVALQGSKSGVTEKITVATAGVFRYPLNKKGGVTVGALVSAVSPNTGATGGVSPQEVENRNSGTGSTAYLGYCIKTESGASFVDFQIRTAFGGGGLAS